MPVPRPLLVALLGVVLVAATFMATRSAREEKVGASDGPVAKVEPSSKPKAAQKVGSKPRAQQSQANADEPSDRAPARRAGSKPVSKPAAVVRAIRSGRVVVLAFYQRGADDRATEQAVTDVRRRRLAAVFTDKIENVGRYGKVVGGLSIDQAPAVVIVDAKRRARVVEGFVDPQSLAQEVADARR